MSELEKDGHGQDFVETEGLRVTNTETGQILIQEKIGHGDQLSEGIKFECSDGRILEVMRAIIEVAGIQL